MANREEESSDVEVLTQVLDKLRAQDGLILERLQTSSEVAPLLDLPRVRHLVALHDIDPEPAAVQVMAQCVRDTTDGTYRIIADAVLGLGALGAVYSQYRLEDNVVQALRAESLGGRRAALLTHWRHLHLAMGLPAQDPPTDRTLRGTMEFDVLRRLAHGLLQPENSPITGQHSAEPDSGLAGQPRRAKAGRVIVVGGAAMDVIFRTKLIPPHETSTLADTCLFAPGGKGVSQAVAAARLGLEVSLVAALGDDHFGLQIVDYLRTENVDTSLLKIVQGARTPTTGVFELPLGDSIAAFWRNGEEVNLNVRDIELLAGQIGDRDAVLLTFEIPRETLHRAIDLAHPDGRSRPIVIVTPGQPYADGGISRLALSQIDYLVAHAWELERYLPADRDRSDLDSVGDDLLQQGVGTICLLSDGGSLIYSQSSPGIDRLSTHFPLFKKTSITRDAFCAALAAKLIDDGLFAESVAEWATAAMASAAADQSHSTSMPDRDRIDRKLRQLRSG